MLDPIVSVPDHCLSFYFPTSSITLPTPPLIIVPTFLEHKIKNKHKLNISSCINKRNQNKNNISYFTLPKEKTSIIININIFIVVHKSLV